MLERGDETPSVGAARHVMPGPWRAPRKGFSETQARAVARENSDSTSRRRGSTSRSSVVGWRSSSSTGRRYPETNVTDDDPETTGRIAWAHLKEMPDYYERLERMEGQA